MDGYRNSSVCVFILEEKVEEKKKAKYLFSNYYELRRGFKGLVRF